MSRRAVRTRHCRCVMAAIWRHQPPRLQGLQSHADEAVDPPADVMTMRQAGHRHHAHFDDRTRSGPAGPRRSTSTVAARVRPCAVLVSEQPFTYPHRYVPHAAVENAAADCNVAKAPGRVALIDPKRSRDAQGNRCVPVLPSFGAEQCGFPVNESKCSRYLRQAAAAAVARR
jgi:hypothetical protein